MVGLFIVGLVAGPAWAELYRWTDDQGVVHYTGDPATIPPAFRDTARAVSHPQARPAPPPVVTPPPGDSPVVPYVPGAPILVVARLNGVPLTLVVDTGADRTVLTPAALARAGFGAEPGRPVEIVGVTGSAAASLVTVPLLDVAGARVGPLAVVVHAIATTTPGGPVDGLLGRDVLDAFTVTVDAGSGRVTLVPR